MNTKWQTVAAMHTQIAFFPSADGRFKLQPFCPPVNYYPLMLDYILSSCWLDRCIILQTRFVGKVSVRAAWGIKKIMSQYWFWLDKGYKTALIGYYAYAGRRLVDLIFLQSYMIRCMFWVYLYMSINAVQNYNQSYRSSYNYCFQVVLSNPLFIESSAAMVAR